MPDIFGYTKNITNSAAVVSPSAIAITIDSTDIMLAQSVRMTYNRRVEPVYTLGSEDIWLSTAPSTGTVEISRAVTDGTLLFFYSESDPCADHDIAISKGDTSCEVSPGDIYASGAVLTSVGVEAQVGSVVVTDNATYTCSGISIS